MLAYAVFLIASFTVPERVGTTAQSLLWLLPLTVTVAVVYKATKVPTVKAGPFLKEVLALFGSIVVFIVAIAMVLFVLAWLISM